MPVEVKPADGESGVLSDSELAQAIASGDQAAFRALMRKYNRLLYRTARSILKDETDAEDALQNAYLLFYRGISKEVPMHDDFVEHKNASAEKIAAESEPKKQ